MFNTDACFKCMKINFTGRSWCKRRQYRERNSRRPEFRAWQHRGNRKNAWENVVRFHLKNVTKGEEKGREIRYY